MRAMGAPRSSVLGDTGGTLLAHTAVRAGQQHHATWLVEADHALRQTVVVDRGLAPVAPDAPVAPHLIIRTVGLSPDDGWPHHRVCCRLLWCGAGLLLIWRLRCLFSGDADGGRRWGRCQGLGREVGDAGLRRELRQPGTRRAVASKAEGAPVVQLLRLRPCRLGLCWGAWQLLLAQLLPIVVAPLAELVAAEWSRGSDEQLLLASRYIPGRAIR
mmetsp:Transcript_71046/g.179293  ORF Transcript_71046/g.179293 Transcript_71046/m.179293 type:complete len:215 (-) Transcript_71046:543-1187(-)